MNLESLNGLLESVAAGRMPVTEALAALRSWPFETLGEARIDHHRALRCGFPEVVFAEGKTTAQVESIVERLIAAGGNLLVTRVHSDLGARLVARFPGCTYHDAARLVTLRQQQPTPRPVGYIAVVSAGTSDVPVAEEARITAELMDQPVRVIHDAGVAGLHRLLAETDVIQQANVIVAVAGMEGALPSVVGGLVQCPVIAVPTSVGYGANFGGISALLAMLNSCAAGISVVNIDNGFGAGYQAALINRLASQSSNPDATRASKPPAPEGGTHHGDN